MTEAAIADAAAATGAEAPPPVAESFGSWMDNFGLDDETTDTTSVTADVPAKEGAEEKPAVAADDQAKDDSKPEAKPQDAASDPEKVEAKPTTEQATEKPTEDPELAPEENALVNAAAPAEQAELKRKFKAARFEDHYLSPDKPKEEVRQYLETRSPSNYAELEQAVIAHRLADPAAFANSYYQQDPEGYGRLALEIYNGAPEYFVEKIAGKKVAPELVRTAVEFYEQNKDRLANQPAGEELPAELIEQARLFLGDEATDKIIAATKAGAPADDSKVKELETKLAKYEESQSKEQQEAEAARKAAEAKAKADAEAVIAQERETVWNTASGQIETYLETWADDPKDGLGLAVTPQERESAPLVADLKDLKRSVLFDGLGDLPDFRAGLVAWGKDRPDFNEKLKRATHFADQREMENAKEAARALLPFVEKYKQERLKAPIFARIDELMKIAAAKSNPKTATETFVPGAAGASSQREPSSDPNKRIDDMLLQDALSLA